MMMQCPVEVWPEPFDELEWFLIDTAASYMTVDLTRFCDVLNYDQRPIVTLGSRSENMQVEATGCLEKFRKLVFSRYVYNVIGGPVLMNHYFPISFEADEICAIKHLPTGFEFYSQKLGSTIFYWKPI